MDYYAVQVRTGREPELLKKIRKLGEEAQHELQAYFPRRVLYIRKKGIRQKVDAPVFPGYIFLEVDTLSVPLSWQLRQTPDFYHFLPNNQNPRPLMDNDLALLRHFLSFGEVSAPSKVYFDENTRICVVEGALKGLEGKIIKVDRRKYRAKVLLDMYTDTFPIDLAFDVIEPASSGSK
jgi:transcription antitermination protein, nusG family